MGRITIEVPDEISGRIAAMAADGGPGVTFYAGVGDPQVVAAGLGQTVRVDLPGRLVVTVRAAEVADGIDVQVSVGGGTIGRTTVEGTETVTLGIV